MTAARTPTTPALPRATLTAGLLATIGWLAIMGPFGTDVYLPALPQIAKDLGTPTTAVQLLVTAYTVGLATGQLILGPLSDRFGRRRLILGGAFTLALSSAIGALAPNVAILSAACLVMGLGSAAGLVLGRSVISDLVQGREATRAFATVGLISGMGPVLGPLGGVLAMSFFGWRGIFVSLAVVVAAATVTAYFVIPETVPPEKRHTGGFRSMLSTAGFVLRDRTYLFNAATLWFSFGMMFAYISSSSFIVQNILGFTPAQYSLVFGANGAGLVLAGVTTAALAKRIRGRRLQSVGITLLLVAATILCVDVWTNTVTPVSVLPALFIIATSMGFIFGPTTALAMTNVRHMSGTALALLGCFQFVSAGIASSLVGIAGAGSIAPLAFVGSGFVILALTTMLLAGTVAPATERTPSSA
jgi:DHA1 family bicyclomycin/chloramphenicol resistance-like MFS transporter